MNNTSMQQASHHYNVKMLNGVCSRHFLILFAICQQFFFELNLFALKKVGQYSPYNRARRQIPARMVVAKKDALFVLSTVSGQDQRDAPKMSEPSSTENATYAKHRRNYMTWRRSELVDELLLIQQKRNHFQEQWLDANDNLLQWQLRALEAEKQLETKQTLPKNSRQ